MFENGLQIGGHPIHAMLVHFPMGLLIGSVGADVAALGTGTSIWWSVGNGMLLFGLIAAVPALIAGFVDYIAVMQRHADEVGTRATSHMLAALSGVGLFLASWLLRGASLQGAGGYSSIGLSVLGSVALLVAGRLGASLIYDDRVGIGNESS